MSTEREVIQLTKEEIVELNEVTYWKKPGDFKGDSWQLVKQDNKYNDDDGEVWNYVVMRLSDGKCFKYDTWDSGHGIVFCDDENTLTQVFPKTVSIVIYE